MRFVLTVEDPERFKKSRAVGPYLSLRPRQDQSGEQDPELRTDETHGRSQKRVASKPIPLNRQIDRATKDVEKIVHQDSTGHRLCTAPGVGSITPASFVATIDMPERFKGAQQVEAYLGLVPRELSLG